MNKEQFTETLSGFIAPRLVEALAEQAEGKGYFDGSVSEMVDKKRLISEKDLRKAVILLANWFNKHDEKLKWFNFMQDCKLSDFVIKILSDFR